MTEKPANRTVIVPVRFTEAECVLLDGGSGGSTRSDYIRWRTLDPDSPPPPRRRNKVPAEGQTILAAAVAKLGHSRIPNNLNQIAKAIHSGSLVLTPDLEAELREAVEHIADIRRMIVGALGLQREIVAVRQRHASRTETLHRDLERQNEVRGRSEAMQDRFNDAASGRSRGEGAASPPRDGGRDAPRPRGPELGRYDPSSTFELYLFSPGRRFHMTGFQIELPEFACGASGTVWSATPSLTILTMFFILTDDERCRLDRIIRAAHTTRIEPHGVRSAGISHPELERRRLIAAACSDWSSQASRWIGKHFPGLLSLDERGLPMCELTVAEGLAPFPSHHENPINAKIVDALKWRTVDTFIPFDEPEGGLFYAPFADWDRGDARYSLVAMTRQTFESQNVDGWGSGDERFVYPFDRSFRHVIAQWAITHVLAYYRGRIALTRDMLVNVVRGQGATRALGKVREQTAECADAATVARDVVEGVADQSLTIYHAGLVHRKRRDTDPDRRMDVALRETLTWRGNGLLRGVSELNATLHAQAALLSAHANLRLQPWIILLAIVSAFAGAIAAIPPARELLAWLQSNPEYTQPSRPSATHRPRHAAPSAPPSAPIAPAPVR